ncbi:MAG: hypothetical protein ACRDRL_25460, partial [Sciscionella sp.]
MFVNGGNGAATPGVSPSSGTSTPLTQPGLASPQAREAIALGGQRNLDAFNGMVNSVANAADPSSVIADPTDRQRAHDLANQQAGSYCQYTQCASGQQAQIAQQALPQTTQYVQGEEQRVQNLTTNASNILGYTPGGSDAQQLADRYHHSVQQTDDATTTQANRNSVTALS